MLAVRVFGYAEVVVEALLGDALTAAISLDFAYMVFELLAVSEVIAALDAIEVFKLLVVVVLLDGLDRLVLHLL